MNEQLRNLQVAVSVPAAQEERSRIALALFLAAYTASGSTPGFSKPSIKHQYEELLATKQSNKRNRRRCN